jgi:hypothetical protein
LKAGAILLALGRPWRQAYDHAERLVLKKANPLPMDYVAAALTDLDLLATKKLRPGLGSAVRAAKEDVVASTYPAAESSGASSTDIDRRATAQEPRRVSLLIYPALAEFGFTPPPDFNPERDRLFAAWYNKTPNGWAALPTLSGPAKLFGPVGGKYYSARALSGCMPGGQYKLELYVNGRLAGSSTSNATVHFPELRQAPLGDLNAEVCRPNDWRPVKDDIPGVASGYVSSRHDPRAGVMLFDMSASGAHGRAMASAALSRFSTMLPSGSKPLGPRTPTFFMGETGNRRAYEYPHGLMIVGTGRTPIGRKLVAVVFEPTAHASRSSSTSLGLLDLFYSLTTRDTSITEPPVR